MKQYVSDQTALRKRTNHFVLRQRERLITDQEVLAALRRGHLTHHLRDGRLCRRYELDGLILIADRKDCLITTYRQF